MGIRNDEEQRQKGESLWERNDGSRNLALMFGSDHEVVQELTKFRLPELETTTVEIVEQDNLKSPSARVSQRGKENGKSLSSASLTDARCPMKRKEPSNRRKSMEMTGLSSGPDRLRKLHVSKWIQKLDNDAKKGPSMNRKFSAPALDLCDDTLPEDLGSRPSELARDDSRRKSNTDIIKQSPGSSILRKSLTSIRTLQLDMKVQTGVADASSAFTSKRRNRMRLFRDAGSSGTDGVKNPKQPELGLDRVALSTRHNKLARSGSYQGEQVREGPCGVQEAVGICTASASNAEVGSNLSQDSAALALKFDYAGCVPSDTPDLIPSISLESRRCSRSQSYTVSVSSTDTIAASPSNDAYTGQNTGPTEEELPSNLLSRNVLSPRALSTKSYSSDDPIEEDCGEPPSVNGDMSFLCSRRRSRSPTPRSPSFGEDGVKIRGSGNLRGIREKASTSESEFGGGSGYIRGIRKRASEGLFRVKKAIDDEHGSASHDSSSIPELAFCRSEVEYRKDGEQENSVTEEGEEKVQVGNSQSEILSRRDYDTREDSVAVKLREVGHSISDVLSRRTERASARGRLVSASKGNNSESESVESIVADWGPLANVWDRVLKFNRGIEPRTMLANKLLGRFLKKAKEDSREREQIQLGLLRMWESGTCAVIERDYVCETFLGAGAFGEVFLGFRKADRTPVAIKRYFNLSNKSEGFDFSIEKEFEYASLGLSHPCLVKTLAAVRNHDGVALVLELMGGGSLQDRLRHRPFLSEDDVKLVMRRVLEGLAHLHRNFVIHRDIKPDNIMFDSDLKLNAKIADFGLCSIGSNSTQLASGMYGTPLYVAPEVIRSSESYSSAVDLWSSGVMMYELLCGSHPFWARNTRAVAKRILKGKAKFSEARWVSVSNHARALVRALLTVDPHERPTAERALAHAWFQSSANHSLKGKFRLARSGSEKLRCEKSDQNEVDLKSALQTVETVQDSLLV